MLVVVLVVAIVVVVVVVVVAVEVEFSSVLNRSFGLLSIYHVQCCCCFWFSWHWW